MNARRTAHPAVAITTAALTLTACGTTHPNYGHWVGKITPTNPSPTCEASRATLEVAPTGKVIFAPNEGTWLLDGAITPDGKIIATRAQPGVDKKNYVTRLDATATATTITGTYATPRCAYTVTLSNTRP